MPIFNGLEIRDIINGTSVDDFIYGNGGDDTLFGNGGNDLLRGGIGADYISGGIGRDTASYSDSKAGVWVTIGGYGLGGTAEGDFVASDIEQITGSDYSDILIGSAGDNSFWGLDGDDIIVGGDGWDDLIGGDGRDYLYGEAGLDYLSGGTGNDFLMGGEGFDDLYGGTGTDTVSYSDSWEGVTATIGDYADGGTAELDFIGDDVENLYGSKYGDVLIGNEKGNKLEGDAGDDALIGYGGNDTLVGGKGADSLHGGVGVDEVDYSASSAFVWVDLRGGYASGGDAQSDYLGKDIEDFRGSAYGDVVIGSTADNDLKMGDGDDIVYANSGDDTVSGGNGKDGLSGENGKDSLYGDAGNDTLFGGANDDRLRGGDGNDTMSGGTGADRFNFSDVDFGDIDTIKDFHRSEGDIISLSSMDANVNLAGNQAFAFLGTSAFTGVAGQLRYVNDGVLTTLFGDVNGDKVADFTIKFTDAPGLIATDFIL